MRLFLAVAVWVGAVEALVAFLAPRHPEYVFLGLVPSAFFGWGFAAFERNRRERREEPS